ncbi:hypothetical protein ACFL1X_06405, partial [Candidatus Hydrogenedentota bacterium]
IIEGSSAVNSFERLYVTQPDSLTTRPLPCHKRPCGFKRFTLDMYNCALVESCLANVIEVHVRIFTKTCRRKRLPASVLIRPGQKRRCER